jgi:hypothetical protein
MAVIRGPRPDSNYFITPRAYARDWRLSLKEKGALMYMMSHSEVYELTTEQMIAENDDGRDSVQTALRGLEAKGYLRRVQRRAAKGEEGPNRTGTFQGYDYEITEPPELPARPRRVSRKKVRGTVAGKPVDGPDQAGSGSTVTGKAVDGETDDGETDDGKAVPKKYPQGLGDQGVLGDQEIPPPTPTTDSPPSPSPDPDQTRGGDDSSNPQAPPDALVDELVALKPGWRLLEQRVREVLADPIAQGHPFEVVRQALLDLAQGTHGKTMSPRRVLEDGPWWDSAYGRVAAAMGPQMPSPRQAAIADCALCDPGGWVLDGEDGPARKCDHAATTVPA